MTRLDLTPKRSLWEKLRNVALMDVNTIVRGGIDEAAIERIEQVLLEADFGVDASMELVEELERASERGQLKSETDVREMLAERIRSVLSAAAPADRKLTTGVGLRRAETGPSVALFLGANGTGKTTTVAKFAHRLGVAGDRVLLAATDTFRAGAQQQLQIWADRVGADFVGGRQGGDPAAVAFDALEAAASRQADWVLVDTAGRLHTEQSLMDEVRKIDRVIARRIEPASHERLLVVDATSGQNVITQAREFGNGMELTGLVLTKFDSTARAGTAVAVARELSIPVRYLGTGEGLEDLVPFDPDLYVEKLLGAA